MKFLFIFLMGSAYALSGIEVPYLIEILSENVKRYEQLRGVIKQGKDTENLLVFLNEGIDNATGLLETLPMVNVEQVRDMREQVERIYGAIPSGRDAALFRLHDETASRAFGDGSFFSWLC